MFAENGGTGRSRTGLLRRDKALIPLPSSSVPKCAASGHGDAIGSSRYLLLHKMVCADGLEPPTSATRSACAYFGRALSLSYAHIKWWGLLVMLQLPTSSIIDGRSFTDSLLDQSPAPQSLALRCCLRYFHCAMWETSIAFWIGREMNIVSDESWINRGKPEVHRIPNFGHIDSKLLRGGQPKGPGSFAALAALQVKTVISFRLEGDTPEREPEDVRRLGMAYINIGLNAANEALPQKSLIEHVLKEIEASPGRVFVHCQYGCERTGLICACWRIRKCGWTPEQALIEADEYGMSEYFKVMRTFILGFK